MQKKSFNISVSSDQKFIYQHTLSVRISDMNYGNHLAATAVPPMLQQTRIKFLRAHNCSEANIGGVGLILVDLYVHYLCESFFDDELFIQLGVESIGKNNAVLVYQIENQTQKKTMAIAKEKIVFFDYSARKVAKTPEIFHTITQTINSLARPTCYHVS